MSTRALITLALVALASASEAFWSCEKDTFRTCLATKPSIPENHFCGPCLAESESCVICKYFTEDPRADDIDRAFLNWWGAWLIVIPAAMVVVAIPIFFFLCIFGRWYCCNTFGGRFPNYGICSPSDIARDDAHPTDRLAPDGMLLRAYSEKEVTAPRKGFIAIGILFIITLILFIIAIAWSGNAADAFMEKGVDSLSQLSIDGMRTTEAFSTAIRSHPTVFASLRSLLDTTRGWVTKLYEAKGELEAFKTENGDGAVFLLNFTKWFALGFTIVAIALCAVGYAANVTKTYRFWPYLLAFLFFWVSAVGFAGVVVSVGPAWYLGDGCDVVRHTITPPAGELSPMSGAISVLRQLSRTPKVLVDFGRGPTAAWNAACGRVDVANTCTALEPHFSCALSGGGCVVPSTPTRSTYNNYVDTSAFTFNIAGEVNVTMAECAAGAASCSCAQFSLGGSRANALAYDKCERFVRAISVELHQIRASLESMSTTLSTATAAFTGPLNVDVVQTKLTTIVDDCDAAATSFIFGACAFGVMGFAGLLGVLVATMSIKRNVPVGHVPLLPEPQDDDAATVRTGQDGDGRTKVVAVLQSHQNQSIVLGELNVPPQAMPLPPSVVQGSGLVSNGGSVYGGTSVRTAQGGLWSPFGAPTMGGENGVQYPPVAFARPSSQQLSTAPSSRPMSSAFIPPRGQTHTAFQDAHPHAGGRGGDHDGPSPSVLGDVARKGANGNGGGGDGSAVLTSAAVGHGDGVEFPKVGAVVGDAEGTEGGDPLRGGVEGPQWASGAVAE